MTGEQGPRSDIWLDRPWAVFILAAAWLTPLAVVAFWAFNHWVDPGGLPAWTGVPVGLLIAAQSARRARRSAVTTA